MGMVQSETAPALNTGGSNSEVLNANLGATGGTPKEGTKAWYDALRVSDKKKYYTPAIQNRMFEDRKDKGDAFYAP